MFRAVLAATLVAASCLPALAQEKMVWDNFAHDKGATLVFGVPETDHALLSFVCDRGNPMVLVAAMMGSKGLKEGDAARVLLSSGKVKKEFPGKAVRNEITEDIDVHGGGKLEDIKAVLAGGKLLTVEVKGSKQAIALDGAQTAFAEFEAACR